MAVKEKKVLWIEFPTSLVLRKKALKMNRRLKETGNKYSKSRTMAISSFMLFKAQGDGPAC